MLRTLSPAKINLFLEVTGKRPDGFHDIESVFLQIDLADSLAVEEDESELSLIADDPALPTGADNLVVKAAEKLRAVAGVRRGARFRLEKRIPAGGGLGGGSSNAAAALRLANRLWKTGLSDAELAAVGSLVGSDVPFFLHGGTRLCRGRGEIIEPLPAFPDGLPLGLALCAVHSDTAAAYRRLVPAPPAEQRRASAFVDAMVAADIGAMTELAFNRFESGVFAAYPIIAEMHARLAEAGMAARLSGSGSALWFFGSANAARSALEGLGGAAVIPVRPFNNAEAGRIF